MSSIASEDEEVEIRQRMLKLERELLEFQQSSKELEEALEEELDELEKKNKALQEQVQIKDAKIKSLASQLIQANAEINQLSESIAKQRASHEEETLKLRQKLVAVEILNDDMNTNDRILENNLKLARELNNDLLEKLALVENDLETEKQLNAQQRLRISNLEANEITSKQQSSKKRSRQDLRENKEDTLDSKADGTILDINDFLASAPHDIAVKDTSMPRSESLGKLQAHNFQLEQAVQKVGILNRYFALKSESTTQFSSQEVQTTAKNTSGTLKHSPSKINLQKLQEDQDSEYKPQTVRRNSSRRKVESSNATSTNETERRKRKKSLLKEFFKGITTRSN